MSSARTVCSPGCSGDAETIQQITRKKRGTEVPLFMTASTLRSSGRTKDASGVAETE
jgi:hypothetical protein